MRDIYYIGGGKGGIGKSVISTALYDYLTRYKNVACTVIDGDSNNPHFGSCVVNALGAKADAHMIPFVMVDESGNALPGGLADVLRVIQASSAASSIIDAPAGDAAFTLAMWPVLLATAQKLKAQVHVILVAEQDDLTLASLLRAGWDQVVKDAPTVFALNEKSGSDFSSLRRQPQFKAAIEAGAVEMSIPRLGAGIFNSMRRSGQIISTALETEPMVNQVLLSTWAAKVHAAFDEAGL